MLYSLPLQRRWMPKLCLSSGQGQPRSVPRAQAGDPWLVWGQRREFRKGNLQAWCQARNTASAASACSTRVKGGQEGTQQVLEGGKHHGNGGWREEKSSGKQGGSLLGSTTQPIAHPSPPEPHFMRLLTAKPLPRPQTLQCLYVDNTNFAILQKRNKTSGSPRTGVAFPLSLLISVANKMPYLCP